MSLGLCTLFKYARSPSPPIISIIIQLFSIIIKLLFNLFKVDSLDEILEVFCIVFSTIDFKQVNTKHALGGTDTANKFAALSVHRRVRTGHISMMFQIMNLGKLISIAPSGPQYGQSCTWTSSCAFHFVEIFYFKEIVSTKLEYHLF